MTAPFDEPSASGSSAETTTDGRMADERTTDERTADERTSLPAVLDELGITLPPDDGEAIKMLAVELSRAKSEADSYLDDLRRVAADFDNYRKRASHEQQATVERAAERVVAALLPVLDSFDAAFSFEPQSDSERKLVEGVRQTYAQLFDVLSKEGLEAVSALGEAFDPELHEAVMSPTEGGGRLVVSGELRKGYRLRDKLLRPALVAVEHED